MLKLLSDKVKTLTPSEVSNTRYQFLDLKSAEPNLGVAANNNDVLVYSSTAPGNRAWINVSTLAGNTDLIYNQANAAYNQANAAYDQANSAYDTANNKVDKSGDTMSGQLVINTTGFGLNVSNQAFVGNTLTVTNSVYSNTLILGHFEVTYSNLTTTSNSTVTIDSFPAVYYGCVKYIVQVKSSAGIHCTEFFCSQDGSSTHSTEYATLLSGPILGYFSFDIDLPFAKLNFQPDNPTNNILEIKVARMGLTY
jgi:hypothetical protein